jgi:adenosylhomocysteine nucleosidase
LGAAQILATRADKAQAQARFAAVAVDLESDIVAAAAARAGLRFAALRAIADPAGRDLPAAALVPLAASGRPDFPRIGRSILWRPWQAGALIGLAREARQALASLERAAPALQRLVGERC